MLRFNRHGRWEMLIGTVLYIAIGFLWRPWLWVILSPVIVWLYAFFRDPDRPIPEESNVMVSPADGTVSDVTEIPHDERLGGPAVRVGIFLSVFNVHVNRVPCDGKVSSIQYQKGKFLNALNHAKVSAENESNTITLINEATNKPIAVVKQIVGLIARRIICDPKVGDSLARGERLGLIKFGSRTELTVPKWLDPTVTVQVGQKVVGARDILVRLGREISS